MIGFGSALRIRFYLFDESIDQDSTITVETDVENNRLGVDVGSGIIVWLDMNEEDDLEIDTPGAIKVSNLSSSGEIILRSMFDDDRELVNVVDSGAGAGITIVGARGIPVDLVTEGQLANSSVNGGVLFLSGDIQLEGELDPFNAYGSGADVMLSTSGATSIQSSVIPEPSIGIMTMLLGISTIVLPRRVGH